jgi:hypothetical protein
MAVILERRGNGWTKHAVVHQCAKEHSLELELVMVSYYLNAHNAREIEPILVEHDLRAILHVDCVLRIGQQYVDIARPDRCHVWRGSDFVSRRVVGLSDLEDSKAAFEREQFQMWAHKQALRWSKLWAIRDACLAALEKKLS